LWWESGSSPRSFEVSRHRRDADPMQEHDDYHVPDMKVTGTTSMRLETHLIAKKVHEFPSSLLLSLHARR
jgi:hypothetical protein